MKEFRKWVNEVTLSAEMRFGSRASLGLKPKTKRKSTKKRRRKRRRLRLTLRKRSMNG